MHKLNQTKLKPGLVVFNAIQTHNGSGLLPAPTACTGC